MTIEAWSFPGLFIPPTTKWANLRIPKVQHFCVLCHCQFKDEQCICVELSICSNLYD